MKTAHDAAHRGSQTKALTVIVACFACSLMLSMTVVTYVLKWLTNS